MGNQGSSELIRVTDHGLYCEVGDFYVDPWRPVARAIVTHAHSDHARAGCESYLTSTSGQELLRIRVGQSANVEGIGFGETRDLNGVNVSLQPAGHILGSSQVRVEYKGEVWVVSGDYNSTHLSESCEAFESVRCHTFITESTFGLPIYQWKDPVVVFNDIKDWWRENQKMGLTSFLPAYPLGKSQRILAGLMDAPGPIGLYGNMIPFIEPYRRQGIVFPEWGILSEETVPIYKGFGLILYSASGREPNYFKKLLPGSDGYASGWMQVRGVRRNRALDRGFVLSDHSDWNGLLSAVKESGAERIGVTHGHVEPFARYLREVMGKDSFIVPTRFEG